MTAFEKSKRRRSANNCLTRPRTRNPRIWVGTNGRSMVNASHGVQREQQITPRRADGERVFTCSGCAVWAAPRRPTTSCLRSESWARRFAKEPADGRTTLPEKRFHAPIRNDRGRAIATGTRFITWPSLHFSSPNRSNASTTSLTADSGLVPDVCRLRFGSFFCSHRTPLQPYTNENVNTTVTAVTNGRVDSGVGRERHQARVIQTLRICSTS